MKNLPEGYWALGKWFWKKFKNWIAIRLFRKKEEIRPKIRLVVHSMYPIKLDLLSSRSSLNYFFFLKRLACFQSFKVFPVFLSFSPFFKDQCIEEQNPFSSLEGSISQDFSCLTISSITGDRTSGKEKEDRGENIVISSYVPILRSSILTMKIIHAH